MCSFSLSSTSSSWPCSLAASLPARAAPREAGEPEGGGHRGPRGGHHGVTAWLTWSLVGGAGALAGTAAVAQHLAAGLLLLAAGGAGPRAAGAACEGAEQTRVSPAMSRVTGGPGAPRSPQPGPPPTHGARRGGSAAWPARAHPRPRPRRRSGPRPQPCPAPWERPHHLRVRPETCPGPVSVSLSMSLSLSISMPLPLLLLVSLPVSLPLSLPFSLSRRYVHPCSLSIPASLPVLALSPPLVPDRVDAY